MDSIVTKNWKSLKKYVNMCVNRSVMSDSVTPWAVARQAALSMGFSKREYWSG